MIIWEDSLSGCAAELFWEQQHRMGQENISK